MSDLVLAQQGPFRNYRAARFANHGAVLLFTNYHSIIRKRLLCQVYERHQSQRPFDIIAVDIIEPYQPNKRRNRFMLTLKKSVLLLDWRIFQLLQTEVFVRFDYFQSILSNNGSRLSQQLGTLHYVVGESNTGPRLFTTFKTTPTRDGIERSTKTCMILSGRNLFSWDEHLHIVLYNLKSRKKLGTTFFLDSIFRDRVNGK